MSANPKHEDQTLWEYSDEKALCASSQQGVTSVKVKHVGPSEPTYLLNVIMDMYHDDPITAQTFIQKSAASNELPLQKLSTTPTKYMIAALRTILCDILVEFDQRGCHAVNYLPQHEVFRQIFVYSTMRNSSAAELERSRLEYCEKLHASLPKETQKRGRKLLATFCEDVSSSKCRRIWSLVKRLYALCC